MPRTKKAEPSAPPIAGRVTLDVKDQSGAMFLRSAVASVDVTIDGKKVPYSLDALLPYGSSMLSIQGKQYIVNMTDLARAMIELHIKATAQGKE